MSKFKICVYAISKNEEKFVDDWVNSMQEADEIVVLDTGSTDKTVEKLKSYGVKVEQKIISPWRFDTARNESLKLISKDVDFCCCVDLDERFKKGWRKELEKHLTTDLARVSYRYTWNFLPDGREGIVFFADKIHRNGLFIWQHPVHETLKQIDFKYTKNKTIASLQLNHYADITKPRTSYLPLLELSVKEDPTSDRNTHYLGREYYFYGRYNEAIKTLKHHLTMPNSKWNLERASSCKYIAYSYEKQKKNKQALRYYKQAIAECSDSRETYFELAKFYFRNRDYYGAISILHSALLISKRELNYMSEPDCWNETPYDILALSYYHIKNYEKAYYYGKIALDLKPDSERLKENLYYYTNLYNKKLKSINSTAKRN